MLPKGAEWAADMMLADPLEQTTHRKRRGTRRPASYVLAGSLAVDAVILALFADRAASVAGSEVFAVLAALLAVVLGQLLGPVLGLAAGLFLGALYSSFAAPLSRAADVGLAVAAVALWSLAAVAVGLIADSIRFRATDLERALGYRMVIPLPAASSVELRASLRALLRSQSARQRDIEDVVLAAQEAFNNAVVVSPGAVDVSAVCLDRRVIVEVRDKGPGFVPQQPQTAIPELLAVGGRGLFLMHRLMDDVVIESDSGGTTVRLTKTLSRRPEERQLSFESLLGSFRG